ncbi:MAG TPA: F0F1 ATP synthase subunit B [Gemmatimonadaceae bacterium]|nr:F0F1 ATP synthase subunit B [Gemmatimonadaceae bacterium]
MRTLLLRLTPLFFIASPLLAQEGAHEAPRGGLLSPNTGLMFWTVIVFVVLWLILTKFAFKPLTAAVRAREQALESAIEEARRDREEAARVLAEHRRQLEGARDEVQRLIVEGRQAGERVRAEILEKAHAEQRALLERAQREIGAERDRAINELRAEAVDLAIRGASKVIERNLDDKTNRALVEEFLASVTPRSPSV